MSTYFVTEKYQLSILSSGTGGNLPRLKVAHTESILIISKGIIMDDEFMCRACGATFSSKDDLEAHNAEAHPEGVPEEDPEEE